jgi:hypothetical protein
MTAAVKCVLQLHRSLLTLDGLRKAVQRSPAYSSSAVLHHAHGATLTGVQEGVLIEFALWLSAHGAPPTKGSLRTLASRPFGVALSKSWSRRLLERHRRALKSVPPKGVAQRRKSFSTLAAVKSWAKFMDTQTDYVAAKPVRVSTSMSAACRRKKRGCSR